MGTETFNYIDSLNTANPTSTDNVSEGDDHIRGIKTTLKNTFPNLDGAVNATDTELNYVDGVTSAIQTQIDTKLPLAGGTMTGAILSSSTFTANSSSSGDYVRMYGSSGTGKWDIYGNGANLRFSDNEGAGNVVFDRPIDVTGSVTADAVQIELGNPLKLQNAAGSATTAEIACVGAGTNTDIGLKTAGSERMRINSSGNVGIGTTSPNAKAHIVGAANAIALRVTNSAVDGNNADVMHIEPSNGAYYGNHLRIQSGRSDFSSSLLFLNTTSGMNGTNGSYIRVQNNLGADIFRVKGDGKVGIGTTSPSSNMQLSGSNSANGFNLAEDTDNSTRSARIFFSNGTSGQSVTLRNEAGGMLFATGGTPNSSSGTERMRIDSSGNVGIGTSSPSYPLDVEGSTNVAAIRSTASNSILLMPNSGVSGGDNSVAIASNNDDFFVRAGDTERMRIGSAGQIGIGGANYGTDGQVLTSTGASTAPAWEDAGGGTLASLSDATVSASDPTATSNVSAVGHLWVNSTSGNSYVCTSATTNDNEWSNIGNGSSNINIVKGASSSDPASGAQEVADTGGTSGAYYINNYTTGNTTQQVYCWIGVNGDNWQKWSPFNTHIGSAHGHGTTGCTGALTDTFSATTANQAGDFKKYTGTSGCGGNSKNTTAWWDGKLVSTMDGLKIMATAERENTSNASHVMNPHIQIGTATPSSYQDSGAGKIPIYNGINAGSKGVGILEFNHSGTNTVMSSERWVNGDCPSDFVLTSSATTQPSSPTATSTSSSIAQSSNQLWINWLSWADYGPDTYNANTWWVNT